MKPSFFKGGKATLFFILFLSLSLIVTADYSQEWIKPNLNFISPLYQSGLNVNFNTSFLNWTINSTGLWDRVGSELTPRNVGDDISTTGDIDSGSLIVDSTTLVVNKAGYEGMVGINTITPTNYLQIVLPTGEITRNKGIEITKGDGYLRLQDRDIGTDFFPAIIGKPTDSQFGTLFRGLRVAGWDPIIPAFTLQAANPTNDGAIGIDEVAIAFKNWLSYIVTVKGDGDVSIGGDLNVDLGCIYGNALRIDNDVLTANTVSNKVGINTIIPGASLDVNGYARIGEGVGITPNDQNPLVVVSSSSNMARIFFSNEGTGDAQISFADGGSTQWSVGWDRSTTDFVIGDYWQLGVNQRLTIEKSTGEVGIGVTNPDSKLEIKGSGTGSLTYGLTVRNSADTATLRVRDDGQAQVKDVLLTGKLMVGDTHRLEKISLINNADVLAFDHDGSNALINTSDGGFVFYNEERVDTDLIIRATPGYNSNLYMGDSSNHLVLQVNDSSIEIGKNADLDIKLFSHSIEGETPYLSIGGFATSDQYRELRIGVDSTKGKDVLFEGMPNYQFDGSVGIGKSPELNLDVAGQFRAVSGTFPVLGFTRETTTTGGSLSSLSGIASAMQLITYTSGSMSDGFGGGIVISGQESGGTTNGWGRLYARRDGGDQEGAVQIWGGYNGADLLQTWRSNGDTGIGRYDPKARLDVKSKLSDSGDNIFIAENSDGDVVFNVKDDGKVVIIGSLNVTTGYTGDCVNTTFVGGIAVSCND